MHKPKLVGFRCSCSRGTVPLVPNKVIIPILGVVFQDATAALPSLIARIGQAGCYHQLHSTSVSQTARLDKAIVGLRRPHVCTYLVLHSVALVHILE